MTTIPETTIEYEQASIAMMVQVRELAQTIHGFGFSGKSRRAKITPVASLPDDFLEAVAVACDAYPQLASAGDTTGAELRNAIKFGHAYTNVANELRLLARGIEDTVAERRSDFGDRALRVYTMAKRINKPEERQRLIPHLTDMQRTLRRGRPAKKAKPPAVPPAVPPVKA